MRLIGIKRLLIRQIYLIKQGVLSFLQENADILHTQGKDYILSAIDDFMKG